MVIESYHVNTGASHTLKSYEKSTIDATLWNNRTVISNTRASREDTVVLSEWAQEMADNLQNGGGAEDGRADEIGTMSTGRVSDRMFTPKNPAQLKLLMLENFLESLTGRPLSFRISEFYAKQEMKASQISVRNMSTRAASGAATGGSINATHERYEQETMSYSAKGIVKTADGRTIDINMHLNMSREFYEKTNVSMEFGQPRNLVDPLVINYGGTAASLTNEKYDFDLTSDGNMESISFAGPGSGFLAVDWNGDGVINDGSELFGPESGNGFDELRKHDQDGNGWIDENDDIFERLVIWSKDSEGNDQLFTLKELGIGAIYLGETETQFSLNDAGNNTNGVVQSTSFYLKEDGGAGYVHHIDLSV